MPDNYNAWGPYILWHYYGGGGGEGWQPRSYPTAAEALDQKDGGDVITKLIKFVEATERGEHEGDVDAK